MPSISYDEIRSGFFTSATAYDLTSKTQEEMVGITNDYLHKIVGRPNVQSLFSELTLDDEAQVLTYTLKKESSEEMDKDFVLTTFSEAMVNEWIKPKKDNAALLSQAFTGKEAKFYSQAAHLSELRGLEEDSKNAVAHSVNTRNARHNSYLDGGKK